MQADTHIHLPARLHSLATMAALLERLERQPMAISADQYRSVARQVSILLAEAQTDEYLPALLAAMPATSELYENLHYAHSGLCRAPLDSAMKAELGTAELLAKARHPA